MGKNNDAGCFYYVMELADEAEEVVQETAIGVARRLPEFAYDPKVCRFKTWLLNLVRWRIQDQCGGDRKWDRHLACPGQARRLPYLQTRRRAP